MPIKTRHCEYQHALREEIVENEADPSKTRILVTGGSGFIGTNLVESYVSRGEQVLNVDFKPPRNAAHQEFWWKVDLMDVAALETAVRKFDPHYIYHMAARTDLDGKSLESYAANTTGVSNIISSISGLTRLKRIIFASSRLVCKIDYQPKDEFDYCPTTNYGESKVAGENIVRASSAIPCPWVIVRPTSIWGPWFDIPYKTFFLSIARNQYVHPGKQEIYKSFGYVENSVYELQKLMSAAVDKVHGKTFFLEDYPPINVREMAMFIQKTMGAKAIKTAPLPVLKIVALIGDMLKLTGWKNPPLTTFRLNNLLTEMVYESVALEAIVGELPYSMKRGVIKTVEWMCTQGEIRKLAACQK